MNYLTSLFSDPKGNISSKRAMGMALIICSIILAFLKSDAITIGSLLGAGTALLSVGSITNT